MNPAFPPASEHIPLSRSLQVIVESSKDRLTINSLLEQTHGRGLYLIMILLCLPFCVPVSIPGMSVLCGTVVMILGLRMARGRNASLPKFIGGRQLSPDTMLKVVRAGTKLLRLLEKIVKPRRTSWMGWGVFKTCNALLIAFMAFLLALPLPPIPPLTNTLPGYAIIFLAASMMEEDGLIIWLGYAVSILTVCWFVFWAELLAKHLNDLLTWLLNHFAS